MPNLEKISTVSRGKALLGQDVAVTVPIYLCGSKQITHDGYYFINRNSKLLLEGPMSVGRNTLFGPNTSIYVKSEGSLEVGPDVWAGAGVTIQVESGQHLTIGRGALLAAGSVVTKDVPENALIVEKDIIKKFILNQDYDTEIPTDWTNPSYIIERAKLLDKLKATICCSRTLQDNLKTITQKAQLSLP